MNSITLALIGVGLAALLVVCLPSMFVVVKPRHGVLISLFGGRVIREISSPGLYFKLPYPFHICSAKLCLDIFQVKEDCKVKTSDEVVLGMRISASVRILKDKMQEACYALDNPQNLIRSDLRQMTCAECANLATKDIYSNKGGMNETLIRKLNENYNQYGFEITDIKIDDPELPDEIRDASNRVVAAKRLLEAAKIEQDTKYVLKMADARADAGALKERTSAAVESRKAYAEVCIQNLQKFKEATSNESEINMLMMSMEALDSRDAVTTAARYGNLVLLGTNQASNELGIQSKIASSLGLSNHNENTTSNHKVKKSEELEEVNTHSSK